MFLSSGRAALSLKFVEFLLIPATFGIFGWLVCFEEQGELVGQRIAVSVLGKVFLPS